MVAVASGMSAFELGSDVAGSIRWPCQATGVFGHKATWGRISVSGHIPPAPYSDVSPDLVVAGPLARSAKDLRVLFLLLADPGTEGPALDQRLGRERLRVGLVTSMPGVKT